ncbi:MAG TPA: sortase [Candidatus Saccharimonadales bacterium]|nr:sortase [Candidatus Saccharimonadales bacterium]
MADDNKKSDQFNASWQLPGSDDSDDKTPAANLIRKKIEAVYANEPDAEDEIDELDDLKKTAKRSKHQEFIYELTNSGRPLHEIQTAWHEYYAGLPDAQKHEVWQEFYKSQAREAQHPAVTHQAPKVEPIKHVVHHPATQPASRRPKSRSDKLRERPRKTSAHQVAPAKPWHSLLFGLGVGCIVILVFMFSFFNERIIAPFIQPSRNVGDIPIISNGSAVGTTPEVIIPKINVEIPVIYDTAATNDTVIQQDLMNGVVHYAGTAQPGQDGNLVIVGHSSNNIFNPGKYKFAFVLLSRLDNGDTFYLQKDGKRYTYQVYKKQIVKPTDVSVLGTMDKPATASLITCDPPGTSENRLVVTGEQIDPSPAANIAATDQTQVAKSAAIIPGNSPSLWSRIVNWFTH